MLSIPFELIISTIVPAKAMINESKIFVVNSKLKKYRVRHEINNAEIKNTKEPKTVLLNLWLNILILLVFDLKTVPKIPAEGSLIPTINIGRTKYSLLFETSDTKNIRYIERGSKKLPAVFLLTEFIESNLLSFFPV